MDNGSDKTGKSDTLNPDEGIDEYELYYGENSVEEPLSAEPEPPGPLNRRPLFRSSIPFFAILILFLICTYMANNNIFADYLWASRETVFTKHEYWRLLTAIFTHADIVHLLSNTPLFFFFGLFLYEYFGFLMFPALSLIIGVSANLVTLYFYPETVRLIGASGMVYGMVSLWLILYIYHDTGHTIRTRIFRSAGFTLIVLFPTTYDPSTSYMVHAAGFFIGIFCSLLILPFVKVKIRNSQ